MMMYDERGLTLIEILVALAIFAGVVAGALGLVGATNTGGLMAAFPTGLLTGRAAKDTTVASVYLQGLQEYAAANISGVALGLSCTEGSGNCTSPTSTELEQWCPRNNYTAGAPTIGSPAGLSGAPMPQAQPHQLDWNALYVLVEQWHWDAVTTQYTSTASGGEALVRLCSVLRWDLKGQVRTMSVDRLVR